MPGNWTPTSFTVGGHRAEPSCSQARTLGTEPGVMDMTEAEYMHLQHLIQVHMEAQAGPPDAGSHPAAELVRDTTTSTQAIDLSSSSEHCQEMPGYGEQTPVSYGDVPHFVLAKVGGEDSPTSSNSRVTSQKQCRTAARVCLEKRFNDMSADVPEPQELQSSVLNNFLAIFQQTTEAQEEVLHAQMKKCMTTDREDSFEVSSPYLEDVFNPVTSMCGQVIDHIAYIIEPSKHQGFFIPKSFSFNFHPETIATKAHYMSGSSPTEVQQLVDIQNGMAPPAALKKHVHKHNSQHAKAAEAASNSVAEAHGRTRKKAPPCASLNQRRERHNSKERERRKRIRLYCDELNKLVPFCDSHTDKVTTLQWTTAYLRYINKAHGDTFGVEFQKSLTVEKGLFLKSNTSLDQETLTIPLEGQQ